MGANKISVSGAKEREKERAKVGNNGQLRIANATSGSARKAAWAKKIITEADFQVSFLFFRNGCFVLVSKPQITLIFISIPLNMKFSTLQI